VFHLNNPEIILWSGRKLDKNIFIQSLREETPVFVQYNVTKKEAMKQDLSRLHEMLDSISEIGAPARGTLLFCFDGWDFDKRALDEIPEVVNYIKRVVEHYPYLWYFLIPELNQHMFVSIVDRTMVRCDNFPKLQVAPGLPLNDIKRVQLDIPAATKQLNDMSSAVFAYGVEIDDPRGALDTVLEWRVTLNL
jgi:hypothetical protein